MCNIKKTCFYIVYYRKYLFFHMRSYEKYFFFVRHIVNMEEFTITIGKSGKPMKILRPIEKEYDEKKNIVKIKEVNVVGKIFSYKGSDIDVLNDNDGEAWWKAVNITKLLDYVNSEQTIRTLISENNKKLYGDLIKFNQLSNSGLKILKNDAKSVYINTAGVFELLTKSKKKEAVPFRKWVNCEVLPSINKTGSYSMYDDDDHEVKFDSNDKKFEDYVKKNSAFDIKNENTLYLGYVGTVKNIGKNGRTNLKVGEVSFKFGITDRGVERAEEHKNIIDNYIMFHVKKCILNRDLEKSLEFELKKKGLLRQCVFGKFNYTELFTTSPDFTIDDVKKFIQDWIYKNDHKYESEAIILAKEMTKLEEIKLEQKKVELEILRAQILLKNI